MRCTHTSVQELLQLLMQTQPGDASFTKTEARTGKRSKNSGLIMRIDTYQVTTQTTG